LVLRILAALRSELCSIPRVEFEGAFYFITFGRRVLKRRLCPAKGFFYLIIVDSLIVDTLL